MTRTIVDYKILVASDALELMDMVGQEMLRGHGWEPLGAHRVVYNARYEDTEWSQTLVRYEAQP